jgi:hypothetical protein
VLGTTIAVTSNEARCENNFLVIANVRSSPIIFTPMTEAILSSESSVLTRAKLHNNPEDGILDSHRRENLKFYISLTALIL